MPGVYVMRDRAGRPLYVGKAGNLRRRVRTYFGPGGRHSRLIGRALEQLEVIDHETCGSEFAALLREDQLIKEMRPPCNRRGTGGAGRYLKLTASSPSPRLYVVPGVRPDAGSYFGPVRSQRLAREAVACLRALYPIDDPDPDARERAVGALAAVLGGDPAALGDLGIRMGTALAEDRVLREAGDGPEAPEALLGTLAELARARRAAGRFAVLVESGEEPHIAEAFFVAGGVVRHRALLDADAWAEQCREGLAVLRRHSRASRTLLAPASMDEAAIVGDRLRQAAPEDGALELRRGWRTVEVLEHIGCAVRRIAESMVDDRPPGDGVLPDG